MSFVVNMMNATEYNGEVVINSIGKNASVYGGLCSDLLKKADKPSINAVIDSKKNCKTGDMFLTGAGKLPCKKILHVVTPVREDDDDNLTLLKKTCADAVEFLISQGYKKIGIPFIGTGANGYTESEAYEAITSVCADITDKEERMNKNIAKITIIAYFRRKFDPTKDYIEDNPLEEYLIRKYKTQYRKGMLDDDPIYKMSRFFENINFNEYLFADVTTMTSQYDFIDRFVDKYAYKAKELNKALRLAGMTKQKRYRLRSGATFSKLDAYTLIFSLDMNRTEAVEFMTICGISFSPLNKLDVFFFNYLNGEYGKARNLFELDEMAQGLVDDDVYFVDALK